MTTIDDPLHFANVQVLILANDLRNHHINNLEDLTSTIGQLQTYMHVLFQIKQQVELTELPGEFNKEE